MNLEKSQTGGEKSYRFEDDPFSWEDAEEVSFVATPLTPLEAVMLSFPEGCDQGLLYTEVTKIAQALEDKPLTLRLQESRSCQTVYLATVYHTKMEYGGTFVLLTEEIEAVTEWYAGKISESLGGQTIPALKALLNPTHPTELSGDILMALQA